MADLVSNIAVLLGVLRGTTNLFELGRDAYRGDKEVQNLIEEIKTVEQSVATVRDVLANCVGLTDASGEDISAVANLRNILIALTKKCEQARLLLEKKLLKVANNSDEDEPSLRNKLSVGRRESLKNQEAV